jgi:PAS domain S-box-containing protein
VQDASAGLDSNELTSDPAHAGGASAPTVPPPSHFEALVDSSDDAILSKTAEGIITSWNPAARRLYGYTAEEAVNQPISLIIPPHRAGEEREILRKIAAGVRVEHYETERVRKDGRMVNASLTVSPVQGPDREIIGASVIARDITERRRAEERAERLRELVAALSESLAPEQVIEVVLQQALPTAGADAVAIAFVSEQGDELELIASSGYTEERLDPWRTMRLDWDLPLTDAVRTGEAVWSETAEALIRDYPALADAEIRFPSLAAVPLVVERRAIGAISLSYLDPHEFTYDDRGFLLAVAHEASQALERGQLYERERLARARAEQAREQLDFLARASALLAESLELEPTLQRVAQLAVPRIADWCAVDLADEGGIRNVAVAHVDPGKVELARALQARYPPDPDAPTGVANVLRTSQAELYAEIDDEMLVQGARDEEHLRITRDLGLTSAMVVPLNARGRTLGAMTFISAESGRRYGEEDLTFAEELAWRAAVAVDNSLRYREEHEAAVTLQRSLLPAGLPSLPGVEVTARYQPAGREVGGDWYDAIKLDFSRLALTIGDVAGRGIQAAAIMGQVRTSLRAYVFEDRSPAEAVGRANGLARTFDNPEMATLFHATLDTSSGELRYVRAGHPPALVRLPDGSVRRLTGRGAPPLGVSDRVRFDEASEQLVRGSIVVLYTDGLIERRGESIEDGLVRLEETLQDGPDEIEALSDRLIQELVAEEQGEDDVALVAFRLAPGGGTHKRLRLPAEPRSLARVRDELERWLDDAGVERRVVHDVVAATNEACANAIEHAYDPGEGATFEVEGMIRPGEVFVGVRDFGAWRPARERGRGRGLELIRQLVDTVVVERDSNGTEVSMTRELVERAAA